MIRRRAIIVTHGVGSARKGETLNDIVEPIVRFLRRYSQEPGDDGPHAVKINVDMRPDHGPARATITFNHKADHGVDEEIWDFTETWWAESFHSSSQELVLQWGWMVLAHQAKNIFFGAVGRRIFPMNERERPYDNTSYAYPYTDVETSRASKVYDAFLGLALLAIFVPAYLVALLLATIFYLLAQLPSWLLIVGPAARLQELLVGTLVSGPGDQHAMTTSYLARHSASRVIISALAPHLDGSHPDYQYRDTVTIIAHSGGCVTSYVALSDSEIKNWDFGENASRQRTYVTWFTVGSGLNIGYRATPGDSLWDRGLDHRIKWVDMWARYDPVSHGQSDRCMQRRIRRPQEDPDYDPTKPKYQQAEGPSSKFVNLRVVNRDNPFSDHGEYWRNYEEVVSRFVHEIMGGPPLNRPLGKGVRKSVQDEIATHRSAVARNFVGWRLIAAAVVLVSSVFGLAAFIGALLLDPLRQLALPWPFNQVKDWLITNPSLGPIGVDALLGIAVLGVAAYLGYRLFTLLRRGALERGQDWR